MNYRNTLYKIKWLVITWTLTLFAFLAIDRYIVEIPSSIVSSVLFLFTFNILCSKQQNTDQRTEWHEIEGYQADAEDEVDEKQ